MSKKLALIMAVFSCLGTTVTFAQKSDQPIKIKPAKIEYRHDFRAGVGIMATGGFWRPMTTYGDKYESTPLVYLFYGYRFHGGWKVSMTLGYNETSYTTTDFLYNTNRERSQRVVIDNKNIRISPSIQYVWYRRGLVTMYSDIGFTWVLASGKRDSFGNYKQAGYISPNLTPFGITVGGKNWYGSAELLSLGARGVFNVGVGYRF